MFVSPGKQMQLFLWGMARQKKTKGAQQCLKGTSVEDGQRVTRLRRERDYGLKLKVSHPTRNAENQSFVQSRSHLHANISSWAASVLSFCRNSPKLDSFAPVMSKLNKMQWRFVKNSNFVAEFFPYRRNFPAFIRFDRSKKPRPSCVN